MIDDTHLSHDTEAEQVESDNGLFSVTSKTIRLRPHTPTEPLSPAPPAIPPGWPADAPPPAWSAWSQYVFKEVNPAGPLKHANVSGNLFGGNIVPLMDSETVVKVKVAQMKLEELQNADSDSFDVSGAIESKRTAPPPGAGGGRGKPAKEVEQTYDKDWNVKVKYPRFDMTVDADNSGEIGGDDHKQQNTAPSKYVPVNDTDGDHDGIPGFVQLTTPDLALTPVRLRAGSVVNVETGTITFTCSAASPLLVMGGAQAVYTPTGKVRLWKVSGARTAAELIVPGTAYPAKELIEKGIFIEGVAASTAAVDIEITAEFNGYTVGGQHFSMKDKARITTYKVDADVDSDNDGGVTDLPYCLEDQGEAKAGEAGKIILANDGDGDADGRPGFADGFRKFDNVAASDSASGEQKFALFLVKVSDGLDLDKIKLRFTYSASDPEGVEQSGSSPAFTYNPAPGGLRLWIKQGKVDRKKESVAAGGDFVPKDVLLTPAQLRMQGREALLYIEGIAASTQEGDIPIKVEVLPTGEPAGGNHWDEVKTTIIGLDLAVDRDRDENIDFHPYGGASADATWDAKDRRFAFWMNNDDDQKFDQSAPSPLLPLLYTEIEEDDKDVAESGHQNWQSDAVDCKRDLEDFARLWVDTSRLAPIMLKLKVGDLQLKLKRINGAGGIKVFRAVEPKGGTDYLRDPVIADAQIDPAGVGYGKTLGRIAGADSVLLPQNALNQPKVPLLFEGVAAGTGYFVPVLVDARGEELGVGRGVFLDLKDPKEFIERYTCGEVSGGAVAPRTTRHPGSGSGFTAPATNAERDYVLYVHGYNMDPNTKQRWIETVHKRLYWLGYKGRVGGFSWPCRYGGIDQLFFGSSEERAWQSGARLEELLMDLRRQGYRVHVMAHSQGNVVAGEALNRWSSRGMGVPLMASYIASQAAIPSECYDKRAPYMPGHEEDTYDVYQNYWAPGSHVQRPALWARTNPTYMDQAAVQKAAGLWMNFYNDVDYALTGGWTLSQKQKPGFPLVGDAGGRYSYSDDKGFRRRNWLKYTNLRFPADRHEIFSYAAGAWGKALGACNAGGVFANPLSVDLRGGPYSYANDHLWHSAQFRSFNAARWQYWETLLKNTGIKP